MQKSDNIQLMYSQSDEGTAPLGFFFLFLYTIAVFVRPHEMSVDTSDWIVVQILAIASFVFTLIGLRPIKLYSQHYLLLGLVPLIMVSAFLNGWGMKGIAQSQALFVSSIIPFFLYSNLLTNISRQKWIMFVCIVASAFMIYNGYIQRNSFDGNYGYGLGRSFSVGGEEMRITYLGFFSDPNDLGMFLVMNMPFVGYFFYRGGMWMKLLMLCFFSLILYGVYITGSRGTLLGVAGVIGAYYLMRKASLKLIVMAVLSAPVLATLLATFGGLTGAEASAKQRLWAWYDGVQMLVNNPVFGIGMGNFTETHGRTAHNSYIHVASELGVPGFSFWAVALLLNMLVSVQLIKVLDSWRAPSKEQQKSFDEELIMNKVMFYSMVGFMVTAFFISRQYVLTMFVFMGMHAASTIRIMKIRPELSSLYSRGMIIKTLYASWGIIILVYLTLKLGL